MIAFDSAPMYSLQQLQALKEMSEVLELAQSQFERLVGDIYSGAQHRSHYKIGRLASMIQASTLMETVAENWVLDSNVGLSQPQPCDRGSFLVPLVCAESLEAKCHGRIS